MTRAVACPDAQTIRQFSLGQLPAEQIETLVNHLNGCTACLRQVEALPANDTLLDVLTAQVTAHKPAPPVVEQLIARLKVLRLAEPAPPKDATEGMPGTGASELSEDLAGLLTPPQAPDEIGRLGSYRVLKVLGQGGMGAVFLAEDTSLDRQVALKVVKPAVAGGASAKQRFLREAKACAALKSEHVITIHQVGEDRGIPFIAMEFLEGLPLDRVLDTGRKLTIAQILRISREIARGLAAAHEKGLIHRDIKPGNVWLDKHSGKAKILDFGLARTQAEDVNLTQSGAIVGTPAYMAPEQARSEKVDGRCDLFSLGCVMYKLCTGEVPFKGETTMAVLMALAMQTPKPVRELNPAIPAALADLIDRLLAKDANDRPASAREVVKTIQAIESGLSAPSVVSAPVAAPVAPVVAPAANPFAEMTEAGPRVVVPPKKTAAREKAPAREEKKGLPFRARNERETASPAPINRKKLLIGAAALAATVVLAGVIIVIKNRDGTENRVEVPGNHDVRIDGNTVTVTPRPTPPQPSPVRPFPPLPAGASPFDALKREDIPADELKAVALDGDPGTVPPELVAVLGDSRLKHWQEPHLVAYSADGSRIVSLANGDHGRVWDAQTGQHLSAFLKYRSFTALSEDGSRVAYGYLGQFMTILDPTTGKVLATSAPHGVRVVRAAFTAKGERLVTVAEDGSIKVSDGTSGKELLALQAPPGTVEALAVTADGGRIATATRTNDGQASTVKVWDTATGKEVANLSGQTVIRLAFTPDGRYLFGSQSLLATLMWDLETPGAPREWPGKLGYRPAFSPDGQRVLLGASVFDLATGKVVATLELDPTTQATCGAFSPDGRRVAFGSKDFEVRIHDAATGAPVLEPRGTSGTVHTLAIRPDGQQIATGSTDRTVKIREASSGRLLHTLAHTGEPIGASFSRDGKRLATLDLWYILRVWDVAAGKVEIEWKPHNYVPLGIAYSPDGSRLLTSCKDGTAKVWQAASGKLICTYTGPSVAVMGTIFTPDGRQAISLLGDGGSIRLWDTQTGQEIRTLAVKGGRTPSLHPDGRRLLVTNSTSRIVDLETGQELATVPIGGTPGVYSPDGTRLAGTEYKDGKYFVVVCDGDGGNPRRLLEVPIPPEALAFSPDSRHLVIGNRNGTVYVFRLAPPPATATKPPVPLPAGASQFDALRREDIPADVLDTDAVKDLPELVAILGKPQAKTDVTLLHVTPDGRQVMAAVRKARQTDLILWDPATGQPIREQALPPVGYDYPSPTQDGQYLLLGGSTLTIFDLAMGQNAQTIRLPQPVQATGYVFKRTISPDGRQVAAMHSVGKQSTLLIVDARDGKVQFTREGFDGDPRLIFSPDGKNLALSRNVNNGLNAWTWMLDAETGTERFTLEGCEVLAFSPDSQRVAVTNRGGGFTIHSASKRVSLIKSSLTGKQGFINYAAFSPDGKRLVTSYSRRLTLFDAETGEQLRQLNLPTGLSPAITFAPDGRHVLVGSGENGTVYVLRLAPPPAE